jgi:flagellar motor switch protein FliM
MTAEDAADLDPGARRLMGSMLEHSGLPVERMPGLAAALEGFIAEAAKGIAPLVSRSPAVGAIEPVRATTLFQAIADCAGLTAAIYASVDPEARMLIALDERIDDLIVASIFGETVTPDDGDGEERDAPRARTPIERALVEEFARGLGRAMEAGFAPAAPLSLTFEGLAALDNASALAWRDTPTAAARFSLPMSGGPCKGLALMPQSLLLPFRKELERERPAETPSADRRWSNSMETGLKQTRLPVTAILEELSMRLGDVANFRIGALLPLHSGDFESVRLECAGRGMFLCKLGQGDGRYRLEFQTSIAEPPAPSTV